MKRVKQTVIKFLQRGLTETRAAAAIAAGMSIGIFPIYGTSTPLVLTTSAIFKLNVPIMLAGMYAMTFVKPLLIIPFLKFGETLYGAEGMGISLAELSRRFAADAPATLQDFGWSFIHAASGWAVAAPVIMLVVYRVALAIVQSWSRKTAAVPIRQSHHRTAVAVIGFFMILGAVAQAEAAVFPDAVNYGGHQLTCRGTGMLRFKGIIPVYKAALYMPAEASASDVLKKIPRKLIVHYRVSAPAEKFNKAGRDILAKTYPADVLNELEANLTAIENLYPDPERGDICAIATRPGRGVELLFNGESLGTVGDDRFAQIYFSIWLGENPASDKLKIQLLGLK